MLNPTHSLLAGLLLALSAQGAPFADDPALSTEVVTVFAWYELDLEPSERTSPAVRARIDSWGEYLAAKSEARNLLITDLELVAKQAKKDKAYLQRDLTYELLLEFEPDHKVARNTLGFKMKKGKWTRTRAYKTPADKKPAKAIASLEAREDLMTGYRMARVTLIEAARTGLAPDVWRTEVDALLTEDLNDEHLRGLLGQVATEGAGRIRWILAETQNARAFRERLKGLMETEVPLAKAAKIESAAPRDFETKLTWSAVRQGGGLTVLSSQSAEEAERHVRLGDGLWLWLPRLLGGEADRPADQRLYLMTTGSGPETLVQACPDVSSTNRLQLPHQTVAQLGSPAHLGVFSDSEVERRERAAFWHIDTYLSKAYGLQAAPAWLTQGIRAYVAERFVGSRLSLETKTVDRSTTGTPSWVSGLRETNPRRRRTLIQLTRKMLEADKAPLFTDLLARTHAELRVEDTLLAYALVAYLVEGHGPAVLDPVLRSIASGAGSDSGITPAHQQRALESGLDVSLPALQLRVHEWVDEIQR